jgi:hypothetical protein
MGGWGHSGGAKPLLLRQTDMAESLAQRHRLFQPSLLPSTPLTQTQPPPRLLPWPCVQALTEQKDAQTLQLAQATRQLQEAQRRADAGEQALVDAHARAAGLQAQVCIEGWGEGHMESCGMQCDGKRMPPARHQLRPSPPRPRPRISCAPSPPFSPPRPALPTPPP